MYRMAFNNSRDLVCHPVILKMLDHKWHLFAKMAFMRDLATHVLLTALWVIASNAWGPSVEVLPDTAYDFSQSFTAPGSLLHALFYWTFFALCFCLLIKEMVKVFRTGHAVRELRNRDLWWCVFSGQVIGSETNETGFTMCRCLR